MNKLNENKKLVLWLHSYQYHKLEKVTFDRQSNEKEA